MVPEVLQRLALSGNIAAYPGAHQSEQVALPGETEKPQPTTDDLMAKLPL